MQHGLRLQLDAVRRLLGQWDYIAKRSLLLHIGLRAAERTCGLREGRVISPVLSADWASRSYGTPVRLSTASRGFSNPEYVGWAHMKSRGAAAAGLQSGRNASALSSVLWEGSARILLRAPIGLVLTRHPGSPPPREAPRLSNSALACLQWMLRW